MNCQQIEDLISLYIENEVSEEEHNEITLHIGQCPSCRKLKEKVEELMYTFPELEVEVPFFVKNRLYYIPESLSSHESMENRFFYLKWVAAVLGTFVLFLNLFYFTNIYPPANRVLHTTVSHIKTFTVETGAFFQKVTESRGMFLLSLFKKDADSNQDSNLNNKNKKNTTIKKNKSKSTTIQPQINKPNGGK